MRLSWIATLGLLAAACGGGECPGLDGQQLDVSGAAQMSCDASTGLEPFDHRAHYTLEVRDDDGALRGYVLVSAGGVARPGGALADNVTHRCSSATPLNGCASAASLECEPVEETDDPGPAGLSWLPMRVTLDVALDPEEEGEVYTGAVTLRGELCTATFSGARMSQRPLP